MSEISDFLELRYAFPEDRGRATIVQIERYWEAFRPYADPDFVPTFCTKDPEAYQQRYWELYLGAMLIEQGFQLRPNSGHGPDFSFKMGDRIVWVEAVSPGPGMGANRIQELEFHEIGSLPAAGQEIPTREPLLRITGKIEDKVKKYHEYRRDGIISSDDPFIIALDTSQLGFFGFHGGSTFPAVLDAVYPLGAMQVHFPLEGGDRRPTVDIQYRPSITKANQAQVPTTRFLDVAYAGISGILCSSRNDGTRLPPIPMIFVHNKIAANPLDPSPIHADEEYRWEDTPNGGRVIKTPAGNA